VNSALPSLALPLDPESTDTVAAPGSALIVQTRLIKAPRARVWAAWTDPAQLGQWWGPKGFSVTTELFEFRVGGHWVFTMHGPDPDPRSSNPGGPRDFPSHIVWTRIESGAHPGGAGMPSDPWRLDYEHLQADSIDTAMFKTAVSFEEQGGHTLLKWRAEFGSVELRDMVVRDYGAAQGGRETTARLAHHTEGDGFDATGSAQGFPLVLSRVLPVPRSLVWRAWTTPELLKSWFCPKPYGVDRCEIDLRPGGRFHTHMFGPDGWGSDNEGSYLEVVPFERLTFTDLLLADWAPAATVALGFTASIQLQDTGGGGTKYTVIARHGSAEARARHAKMGFHEGWGSATSQLVEAVKSLG